MVAHPRTPLRTDRLRVLNRPVRVKVKLDDRGRPKTIEDDNEGGGSGVRRVESIIETWRIDDEWWRRPISRECFEVVLEGGAHVVVFEDLITGNWFVQRP